MFHSGFFKGRLSERWIDAHVPQIEIPCEPAVVRMYICWLYTGQIRPDRSPSVSHEGERVRDKPNTMCLTQRRLACLWILADYTLTRLLMKPCINFLNDLIKEAGEVSSALDWHYIYQYTSEDSALRRMLVDAVLYRGGLGRRATWPERPAQAIAY